MGGGDLNPKKSWHPTTLKNQEKVWKVQQQDEMERKRIEQLQQELKLHREKELYQNIADETRGASEKKTKMDWMYKGVSGLVDTEDYLLGRKVDKTFDVIKAAEEQEGKPVEHGAGDGLPSQLFRRKNAENDIVAVDMAAKVREDPLYMIKRQEYDSRKQLLSNPVKMKMLQEMIAKAKAAKSKKHKKHKKSKKKDDDDSDINEADIDAKLAKYRDKLLESTTALLKSSSRHDSGDDEKRSRHKSRGADVAEIDRVRSSEFSSRAEDARETRTKRPSLSLSRRDYEMPHGRNRSASPKRKRMRPESQQKASRSPQTTRRTSRSPQRSREAARSPQKVRRASRSPKKVWKTSRSSQEMRGSPQRAAKFPRSPQRTARYSRSPPKAIQTSRSGWKTKRTSSSPERRERSQRKSERKQSSSARKRRDSQSPEYDRERNSGSQDKRETDKASSNKPRADGFGLITSTKRALNDDGYVKKDYRLIVEERKKKEEEERRQLHKRLNDRHSRNLTQEEREAKLREMQQDAAVHEKERLEYLKIHKKIAVDDAIDVQGYREGGFRGAEMLAKAVDSSSVERRLKSNLKSVQKSSRAMETNFLRK